MDNEAAACGAFTIACIKASRWEIRYTGETDYAKIASAIIDLEKAIADTKTLIQRVKSGS